MQSQRGLQRKDAFQRVLQPLRGDDAVPVAVQHVSEVFLGVAEEQEHVAAGGDGGGYQVAAFHAWVSPIIWDASVRMRPLKPSSSRSRSCSSSGDRVAGRISVSVMPGRYFRDSSGAPMWPTMMDWTP